MDTQHSTVWQIIAPARLHLGFIELNQNAPRCFGSIGITLQEPAYQIEYTIADILKINGDVREDICQLVNRFDDKYNVQSTGKIDVLKTIPRHSGLGSGTQLSLAIGHLLAKAHRIKLSSDDIAATFKRGKRSGIGIASFDYGGFIVDAGKSQEERVPPMVAQLSFPNQWRIILLFDNHSVEGLHGDDEKQAFAKLQQNKIPDAAHLSHIILMSILPSIREKDYECFSESLGRFQQIVGNCFIVHQGGRYTSKVIGNILEYLNKRGITGIGQSSWGPTGYVVARDLEHSRSIQSLIEEYILKDTNISENQISILDTTASPSGGVIEQLN